MRKILLLSFSFFFIASSAHAASAPVTYPCNKACNTYETQCKSSGGTVVPADPLSGSTFTCSYTATATTPAATAPAANTANTGSNFVPLTNIPGLIGTNGITSAQGLTAFFNDLYKICIGVAATLAVLQIMRAGIMYMGGDSVTETKVARELIATAIGGLVLVLSPVIVFSIINPKILSLNVGLNSLAPIVATAPAAATTPTTPTCPVLGNGSQLVAGVSPTCCTKNGAGWGVQSSGSASHTVSICVQAGNSCPTVSKNSINAIAGGWSTDALKQCCNEVVGCHIQSQTQMVGHAQQTVNFCQCS